MDNGELMNRRRFFKKAAKGLLPMLGAFIAAPTIFTTLTSCGCNGCEAACSEDCDASCSGKCYGSCSGSCEGGNSGTSCSDCGNSCSGTCSGSSTSPSCSDCSNTCSETCGNSCTGACEKSCADDCSTSCQGACSTSCSTTCEGSATGKSTISEASGTVSGYEYVDLGLSVKWARYNIGASKPEDKGKYYQFADENMDPSAWLQMNKAGYRDYDSISGTRFDAARKVWGSNWRLPTKKECEELLSECTCTVEKYNDIKGMKAVGKNGNSIFFPTNNVYANRYNDGVYLTGNIAKWGDFYVLLCEDMKVGEQWGSWSEGAIRAVTGSSDSGGGNGGGGGSCSGCSNGCSDGCKTTCSGTCPNGCQTLCYGSCENSCGGTCEYVSAGSSCTSCARSCSTHCYHVCTLACSSSCMAYCVNSSK